MKEILLSEIKLSFLILLIIPSLISSHPKGDELRKLTLESENGIIYFTSKTFNEYVMTHPRPYDVIILFTLSKKCKLCQRVKNEFIKVAESYRDENGFKPDMVNHKRAVFFGILYYSDGTKSIKKKLNFPTNTTILYTIPKIITIDEKTGEKYINYDDDYIIGYKDNSDKVYALKMMEFANAKSLRKFPLKKNPFEFLLYFFELVFFSFLAFIIYKSFKSLLLSPTLWLIGSMSVFLICIGGIVYNILRGSGFAKFDKEGNLVEFIQKGRKKQYIGEGIIMSTLFLISGTLFYSLNWINKVKGYYLQKILSLAAIFSQLIIMKIVVSFYRIKVGWYQPTFSPPNGYMRGPLIKDQGNSF